ncbi:hypothetical protein cypCar_00002134 [Cyprinus carpio]|nr:hypothetical protein cypCar_00002134 [Cyprinus carpio]
MADDLDELLDEVESKFCCSTSASKQSTYALKQTDQKCVNPEDKTQSRKQGYKKARDDCDIDAMLQEILDDDYQPTSTHESIAAKTSRSDACSQTMSKKCCPVFLGGSSVPHGIGTSVSQRNNMPDHHKLKAKLRRKKDGRAYACQCSWHSAMSLSDLREQQQLKWVCGKHKV